jgi:uncharacterized membrane protein
MAKRASSNPKSRLPMLLRIVHARVRLFVSALIGLAIIPLLPSQWPLAGRCLVGWDLGIAIYLVASYWVIAQGDTQHIRRQAAVEDEGKSIILALTVAAALATIGAIVVELNGAKEQQSTAFALALAILTILLSWTFIHTIFALHYAHEYFGEGSDRQIGGLQFPGEGEPDYWDFVYFSFVIGMTFQVSDVQVTSKIIRRLVAAHGVVSFIFNTALLALMVNIAANAM